MSLWKWAALAAFLVLAWEIFFRAEWLRMKREGLALSLETAQAAAGLTAPGTVIDGPMAPADLSLVP